MKESRARRGRAADPAVNDRPSALRRDRRGVPLGLRSRDPDQHLRPRPRLHDRDHRRGRRRGGDDADGAGLSGCGRDAGVGRERGLVGSGRAQRRGRPRVGAAVGHGHDVGRGTPRTRLHVTAGLFGRVARRCFRRRGPAPAPGSPLESSLSPH